MTIYNSIKQTGRYLLATGALLTALYSCENKSNFDNKSDLTVKYDASLPDLENILSDMLDNQIPSGELGTDGSPEEDYVLNKDGSIDIPLDDLYDNPDQMPSGELGTDGSPKTDYVLNDQIPTEEINLEDLLQEDNSREDTDPCANNHPPYISATSNPPSGSTIKKGVDIVDITIHPEGTGDIDGNLDHCQTRIYRDGENIGGGGYYCDEVIMDRFFSTGEYEVEVYSFDTCGERSEFIIFNYHVVEN